MSKKSQQGGGKEISVFRKNQYAFDHFFNLTYGYQKIFNIQEALDILFKKNKNIPIITFFNPRKFMEIMEQRNSPLKEEEKYKLVITPAQILIFDQEKNITTIKESDLYSEEELNKEIFKEKITQGIRYSKEYLEDLDKKLDVFLEQVIWNSDDYEKEQQKKDGNPNSKDKKRFILIKTNVNEETRSYLRALSGGEEDVKTIGKELDLSQYPDNFSFGRVDESNNLRSILLDEYRSIRPLNLGIEPDKSMYIKELIENRIKNGEKEEKKEKNKKVSELKQDNAILSKIPKDLLRHLGVENLTIDKLINIFNNFIIKRDTEEINMKSWLTDK